MFITILLLLGTFEYLTRKKSVFGYKLCQNKQIIAKVIAYIPIASIGYDNR